MSRAARRWFGFALIAPAMQAEAQWSFWAVDNDVTGRPIRAVALSSDGSSVVGSAVPAWGAAHRVPFRWNTQDGFRLLSGDRGVASGVSGDGSAVAGTLNGGFRWTINDGVLHDLGLLPGGDAISPAAISGDGRFIVGWGSSAAGNQAFRWSIDGRMVGLGGGGAKCVSEDGSVVVGGRLRAELSGDRALRWTAVNGMREFLGPEERFSDSTANAVSADGTVVVGSIRNNSFLQSAFRWSIARGLERLVPTNDREAVSEAFGVSRNGSVIVGTIRFLGPIGLAVRPQAFRWTAEDGIRVLEDILIENDVDFFGWSLDKAVGVSADGLTITGNGGNPPNAGIERAWIVFGGEPEGSPPRLISSSPPDGSIDARSGDVAVDTMLLTFNRPILNADLTALDATAFSFEPPSTRVASVSRDGTLVSVQLFEPIPWSEWVSMRIDFAGSNGLLGTATVRLAHLPGDIDGNSVVDIRDATAFGEEFRKGGLRNHIDLNNDGTVDVQDATEFGTIWRKWNGTRIPSID